MLYLFFFLLISILLVGFIVAYRSELESQDCTEYCSHWVHNNKSRWRHNIGLTHPETIQERIKLFYSVVEWRRSLIVTIIITLPICLLMFYRCNTSAHEILKYYVLSFVYVFIAVFFISMYYQDLWYQGLKKIKS